MASLFLTVRVISVNADTNSEYQAVSENQNVGVVTTDDKITYLYTSNGSQVKNRALGPNTPWVTDKTIELNNGNSYYRVATNEYVLLSDVTFKANQKVLGVPYISQEESGAPMGCEAASGLEALHYKGYITDMNLKQFIATMPRASDCNPYHGFASTPYKVTPGIYQSIFPSSYTPWLNKFGHAQNISGSSLEQLEDQINKGNPVVTWVTLRYTPADWQKYFWGWGVNNAHVVTLDGYNQLNNEYHISDPELGQYWISKNSFNDAYSHMKFAVAVY